MPYQISREEFTVLTYLHEYAEAFDPSSTFNLTAIQQATSLTAKDVSKAVSYLASLGLAGHAQPPMVTFGNKGERLVYLTAIGEQFMREVEEQLSDELERAPVSRTKIGLAVVGFIYDAGKAVIVKVLADMLTSGH